MLRDARMSAGKRKAAVALSYFYFRMATKQKRRNGEVDERVGSPPPCLHDRNIMI
jgi:hypothetical protein